MGGQPGGRRLGKQDPHPGPGLRLREQRATQNTPSHVWDTTASHCSVTAVGLAASFSLFCSSLQMARQIPWGWESPSRMAPGWAQERRVTRASWALVPRARPEPGCRAAFDLGVSGHPLDGGSVRAGASVSRSRRASCPGPDTASTKAMMVA